MRRSQVWLIILSGFVAASRSETLFEVNVSAAAATPVVAPMFLNATSAPPFVGTDDLDCTTKNPVAGVSRGYADFSFSLPSALLVRFFGTINAPDTFSNSFWIGVDPPASPSASDFGNWGDWSVYNTWIERQFEVKRSGSDHAACCFSLAAGSHFVRVQTREAGGQFAQLRVVEAAAPTVAAVGGCVDNDDLGSTGKCVPEAETTFSITGTGFCSEEIAGLVSVTVGGEDCPNLQIEDDTHLSCTMPPGTHGQNLSLVVSVSGKNGTKDAAVGYLPYCPDECSGQGQCIADATCTCFSGWKGASCDVPDRTLATGLGAGLGGVVFAAALGIGVFVAFRVLHMRGPTRSVFIVFTDIEASTSLWGRKRRYMHEAISVHEAVCRRLIRREKGYEVKTDGDSFMVAFKSAKHAVVFCVALQEELLGAPWPDEILTHPAASLVKGTESGRVIFRGLRVRAAVHAAVEFEAHRKGLISKTDYLGPDINLAARAMSLAHGGEVVITQEALAKLCQELDSEQPGLAIGATIKDMGESRVKGIDHPIHTHQVLPALLAERTWSSEKSPSRHMPRIFSADAAKRGGSAASRTAKTSTFSSEQMQAQMTATTTERTPGTDSGLRVITMA